MSKPCKIELISDGDGQVVAFVNSQPQGTYFCEYDLLPALEQLLNKLLTKYPPSDNSEPLPF